MDRIVAALLALLVATSLTACNGTSGETVKASIGDAAVDALAGTGTSRQARVETAIRRSEDGRAVMDGTTAAAHPMTHRPNAPSEAAFGRHTIVVKNVERLSSPTLDVSDPSQAALLKQVNGYVAEKKLCERSHVLLFEPNDPLPRWDATTREARLRVACVDM